MGRRPTSVRLAPHFRCVPRSARALLHPPEVSRGGGAVGSARRPLPPSRRWARGSPAPGQWPRRTTAPGSPRAVTRLGRRRRCPGWSEGASGGGSAARRAPVPLPLALSGSGLCGSPETMGSRIK